MSPELPSSSRRTVLFSGRVQGVGFRYTTCAVARSYEVTGIVRNLADGRVEMVAEGETVELARFQDAVEEAMRRYIRDVSVEEGTATGEFRSFEIAF